MKKEIVEVKSFLRDYLARLSPSALGLAERIVSQNVSEGVPNGPAMIYTARVNSRPLSISTFNSRSRAHMEYDSLKVLANYGIASKPLIFEKDAISIPFIITEGFDGTAVKEDLFGKLPSIIQGMNCLVGIPIEELRRTGAYNGKYQTNFEAFQSYKRELEEKAISLSEHLGTNKFIRFARDYLNSAEEYAEQNMDWFDGKNLSLIHSNLSRDNILINNSNKVRFINWADSKIFDPAFEIIRFFDLNGFRQSKENTAENKIKRKAAIQTISSYAGKDSHLADRIYFYYELMKLDDALKHAHEFSQSHSGEMKTRFIKSLDEMMLLSGGNDEGFSPVSRSFGYHKRMKRESKEFLEVVKPVSLPERLKSYCKKAALAGLAGLALFSGAYYDQRKPRVVETSTENGAIIEIYDKKNVFFPMPFFVDELIWGKMNNTSKLKDGKVITKLDKSVPTINAKGISSNWNQILENKQSCYENKKCNLEYLAITKSLEGVSRDKIEQEYVNRTVKSMKIHELRHIADGVDKYDETNSEMRAILTELMHSPVALENIMTYLDKKNFNSVPFYYTLAASRIYSEFKRYPEIKSEKDLLSLPDKEISKKSLEIFNKKYPN